MSSEVTSPVSLTGEMGQLPPRDLAPPWRRLCAFVIDVAILTILLLPLLIPAVGLRMAHQQELAAAVANPLAQQVAPLPFWASEWFVGLVTVVVFGLYRVPQEAAFGRSIGHRVLGLRIVRFTGARRIGVGRAVLRYLAFYGVNVVPVLGSLFMLVNYLWCLFDKPYRQCLHDKVAGTFVVHRSDVRYTPQPPAFDTTPAMPYSTRPPSPPGPPAR